MHPIVEKIIVTLSLVTGFFTGSIYMGNRGKIMVDVLARNGREPVDFSRSDEIGERIGRMKTDDPGGLKRFLGMSSLENNSEVLERFEKRCRGLLGSRIRRMGEKYDLAKFFCSRELVEE